MTLKPKVDRLFLKSTPSDKGPIGQHVVDGINANSTQFPALPFTITAMRTANNALSVATANAKSGNHTDIAIRDNAEKNWDNIFGETADYVSFLAKGNAAIITLAGFTPTSSETKPGDKPGAAVIARMTQHEGGVVEIEIALPDGSKAAAYLSLGAPKGAQITAAADGTITIKMASGEEVFAKCDTHRSTTMGGMKAGTLMQMVVQPVNNKGAGGLSTPKAFTPQP